MSYYTEWAANNPHIWGHEMGYFMFTIRGFMAFGVPDYENEHLVTLHVIGQWYKNVARRLRGETPLEIVYGSAAQ